MKYFVFGLIFLYVSLISLIPNVMAQDTDSTGYAQVGTSISLQFRAENPTDSDAPASIVFKFTNVDGENYWDDKTHTGVAAAHSNFVAHQDYYFQKVGRFYIDPVYDVGGTITTNKNHNELIVYENDSKASLNGCGPVLKIIITPDYSKAVCVFSDSVEKLVQRGWVTD